MRARGHVFFEWAPVLEAALQPHPDVSLVLSTSWVEGLGFDSARARLPEALRERVIGATWHSAFDQQAWYALSRYQQIARYVHRHGLQRWIALDDDFDEWAAASRSRLVPCHPDHGIGCVVARARLESALHSL